MTALLALPAATLVIILIAGIILAVVLAKLTTRKPSDGGLRYEYQIRRNSRRQ